MAGKIFINYRRDDTSGTAGRLHDRLRQTFGRENLFMDVDQIPVGVDFEAHLNSQVAACDVMLVVIGPNWLRARDKTGQRRLNQPDDFVAIEIASALARNIRVIPVLVDGARMPSASDLPDALKPLARRQAAGLRNANFGQDAQSLIARMREPSGNEPAVDVANALPNGGTSHQGLIKLRRHGRRDRLISNGLRNRFIQTIAGGLVIAAIGGYAVYTTLVEKQFTPVPLPNVTSNPENAKYVVLVFYRPDRFDDAQHIVGALKSAGYNSDGMQSSLNEVMASDKRPKTSLIKTTTSARPIVDDVLKLVKAAIPMNKDFVSIFPDDAPLQRGSIQISLF
jgi:hypothetical protein